MSKEIKQLDSKIDNNLEKFKDKDGPLLDYIKSLNKGIDDDNEYVMYIIVNNDLKMGKGKIASQCCHSVGKIVRILEQAPQEHYYYTSWLNNHEPMIILKANQKEINKLIKDYKVTSYDITKLWCVPTHDAGRTQIAPNSLTTLAFRPMMRKYVPQMLKSLKLL